MRHLVFLSVAWSVLLIIGSLFWPWSVPGAGCWRLVDPPAGCLAQLAEANDRLWWTQTIPLLALAASGYIVVGLLAIRRWRRSSWIDDAGVDLSGLNLAQSPRAKERVADAAGRDHPLLVPFAELPHVIGDQLMDRAVFYLRIFPGTEAEYDRRHAEIWPELVDEIRESGLRNFSGFRRGTDVWYYTEAEPGLSVEDAFAIHRPKPANQRWNRYFRDVIANITDDSGSLLHYDKVFESDGPALDGPHERGLFGLVIDPERADDYEAFHANPWPDLMEGIEASGFRKYQGFRRGAHVVYYGEFYPDMTTVFARMAELPVNARWGAAFEGIITTIVDAEGKLLTADEIYHQD